MYNDKNGNEIHDNMIILYENNTYIVFHTEKEDKWICHPCGDNTNVDDIDLSEIHEKCEINV